MKLDTNLLPALSIFLLCASTFAHAHQTDDAQLNQAESLLETITGHINYSVSKFKRSYFWLISGNPCGFQTFPYNTVTAYLDPDTPDLNPYKGVTEGILGYRFRSSNADSVCDPTEQLNVLGVLLKRRFGTHGHTSWCLNVTESGQKEGFVVFGDYTGFGAGNCAIDHGFYGGGAIDREIRDEL